MKIKYRQGNLKARVFLSIFLGIIILFCLVVTFSTMSCKSPEVKIDPITLLPITVTDDGKPVIDDKPIVDTVIEPTIVPSGTVNEIEKQMEKVIWLTPGKVNIDNLYPGGKGEYIIRVHNPKNETMTFTIYNREATTCTEGYYKLPPEFNKWIIITPSTLIVPAKSVGEVTVKVEVGLRDKATNKKYETWIGVIDAGQTGMIRNELCSRWMITTK
jgi:hypothetical protein